jgi:hypothetical protein
LTESGTNRTFIHMFSSFQTLIDAWPSLADFAADIRISENTAKGIRRRDNIPSAYWADAVIGAAQRGIEGVTLEALAALAKARGSRADAIDHGLPVSGAADRIPAVEA